MKTRTLFGSILITLLCTIAFVSCSKDDDGDDGKGQNDPGQLVVTGGVDEKGDNWAELEGYLNNTDDDGKVTVSVAEYGIEVCLEDGSSEKRVASKNLSDGEFSVKVTGLTPGTNYKYRAYANIGTKSAPEYKYGKYKKFATDKSSGEPSDPNVLDISTGEVTANGVLFNGLYYTFDGSKATVVKADPSITDVKLPLKVKFDGKTYDLTAIGEQAFVSCTKLTSVNLTYAITSIGEHAFKNCSSLENITLPTSLKEIKNYTFMGCSKLKTIEFPTSLEKIGDYAFYDCGLTSLKTPANLKEMGKYCFAECNFNDITIMGKLTEIPEKAFVDCYNLETFSIPSTVKKLGKGAFMYCYRIKEINLPENLEEIGEYCFQDVNYNLEYLFIPKGVTKIGSAAFQRCSKLQKVSFASGIKTIDSYAFYGTPKNITVTMNVATPPTLGNEAFTKLDSYENQRTLIVPASYLSTYTSNSTYKSYFKTIKAAE